MFRRPHACLAALVCALMAMPAAAPGRGVVRAQPQGPAREIIPLTGDLYRARNGNWYTIFLVTPDGIILGDPINPAFAAWLKGELAGRFPVPVRDCRCPTPVVPSRCGHPKTNCIIVLGES